MKHTTISPRESVLRTTSRAAHPNCFACGEPDGGGLGLVFHVDADEVHAEWRCPAGTESYPGILHGGLIATLLDSAMVHALFARGIVARTGDLQIRYRNPVNVSADVQLRARIRDARDPLFRLEATLSQGGSCCARAEARFMRSPE